MPLSIRREKLSLQYILQSKSNAANPTYECVSKPKYPFLFEARQHVIPTLGICLKQQMEEVGINYDTVAQSSYPSIPLWTLRKYLGNKRNTPPDLHLAMFRQLKSLFCDYTYIYSDGSEDVAAVAAAVVSEAMNRSRWLQDNKSVFSAEAYAILHAVDSIKLTAGKKVVIFSDSLACLHTIARSLVF